MDDTSISTTPSDQLELNTAFCMQGKKNWKTSNLEVLGVWFLGEKKMPSFDWGALGIVFP